jgi:hypothetical protein
MATRKPNKEKKKPKKTAKSKGIWNPSMLNGKITTKRAMYDNNLVGLQPNIPTQMGY